jgi:glutamine synthetase
MQPNEVKNSKDLKELIQQNQYTQIKVGVIDIDGIMRGKYMAKDKFLSSLDSGFGFCDVVLGWDSNDVIYDNAVATGWHLGFGDTPVRVIPDSVRNLPIERNMLFVQGEFSGKLENLCPRAALRRVLEKGKELGFEAYAGIEYEFLVCDESHESIMQKNYRNPKPLGFGAFGYSVIRNSVHSEFYRGLMDLCSEMNMPVEGFHEETGPGALEIALTVDKALIAADNAAVFKTFSKVYAERQGKMISYMAKWSKDYSGQGGHIHISLKNKDDNSVFYDENANSNISKEMLYFIGGIQKYLPELTCMSAPTINSFRRLVPGFWAPTTSQWGIDNRTVAIRAIPGSKKSQRIEFRLPGADANPYLALASALICGYTGIQNKIEPDAPISGNGYENKVPKNRILPRSLWDAAGLFRKSKLAEEWLGEDFVNHFATTREWEEREFQKNVTDWELKRYFEVI